MGILGSCGDHHHGLPHPAAEALKVPYHRTLGRYLSPLYEPAQGKTTPPGLFPAL